MAMRLTWIVAAALIWQLPSGAQEATNSTAATGDGIGTFGHSTFRGTETNSDYRHEAPPGNVPLAPQGWADMTNTQGIGSPNGPDLPGTPSFAGGGGSSGAASSAPLAGSFEAPGNIALRQLGKKKLPPTRLESFVRNSGMSENIYGDEGVYLPPFFGFDEGKRIERGINMPDLHTGHKSDAPSAWGYPQ